MRTCLSKAVYVIVVNHKILLQPGAALILIFIYMRAFCLTGIIAVHQITNQLVYSWLGNLQNGNKLPDLIRV
jgi:hypothetical protein